MSVGFSFAVGELLTNDAAVKTAPPMSMVAWFNSHNISQDIKIVVIAHHGFVDDSFALEIVSAPNPRITAMTANFGTGTSRAIATLDYTVDTWHHAAGTWGSSTDRNIFMDGGNTAQNTESRTPANTPTRTWLGGRSLPENSFDGDLAEVAMYDVKLTAEEVAAIASGMSPLSVRPEALLAYWPLHGRTGRKAF